MLILGPARVAELEAEGQAVRRSAGFDLYPLGLIEARQAQFRAFTMQQLVHDQHIADATRKR